MRENLTSGSEGGCWKHDLSNSWQVGVPVRQRPTLLSRTMELSPLAARDGAPTT